MAIALSNPPHKAEFVHYPGILPVTLTAKTLQLQRNETRDQGHEAQGHRGCGMKQAQRRGCN